MLFYVWLIGGLLKFSISKCKLLNNDINDFFRKKFLKEIF